MRILFSSTTQPTPHLDGLVYKSFSYPLFTGLTYCSIHMVFGQVVDRQKYVSEMENQWVDTNHRPYVDIRIMRCGELHSLDKA